MTSLGSSCYFEVFWRTEKSRDNSRATLCFVPRIRIPPERRTAEKKARRLQRVDSAREMAVATKRIKHETRSRGWAARYHRRRVHNNPRKEKGLSRLQSPSTKPSAMVYLPWLTTRLSSFPLSKIESIAALARASTSMRLSPPSAALHQATGKKKEKTHPSVVR